MLANLNMNESDRFLNKQIEKLIYILEIEIDTYYRLNISEFDTDKKFITEKLETLKTYKYLLNKNV